jgi:hypothetical protein
MRETRNADKIFVGKPEWKRQLGRHRGTKRTILDWSLVK